MNARYPDISDIIAQKARGRRERARLSFGEKLEILDKLRASIEPIVHARQARRSSAGNADTAYGQKPAGSGAHD